MAIIITTLLGILQALLYIQFQDHRLIGSG